MMQYLSMSIWMWRGTVVFMEIEIVVELLNCLKKRKQSHQLGHLLTGSKAKRVVARDYYLLLSATDTNVTFTSGSSVL